MPSVINQPPTYHQPNQLVCYKRSILKVKEGENKGIQKKVEGSNEI